LLTRSPASVPRWSPDGKWIAFSPDRSYGAGVFIVRPDGTDERRLTPTGGWPIWWPDGRRIGYRTITADARQQIESIMIDGSPAPADRLPIRKRERALRDRPGRARDGDDECGARVGRDLAHRAMIGDPISTSTSRRTSSRRDGRNGLRADSQRQCMGFMEQRAASRAFDSCAFPGVPGENEAAARNRSLEPEAPARDRFAGRIGMRLTQALHQGGGVGGRLSRALDQKGSHSPVL
jgi:hypothetical protein